VRLFTRGGSSREEGDGMSSFHLSCFGRPREANRGARGDKEGRGTGTLREEIGTAATEATDDGVVAVRLGVDDDGR
jgi:hypothetical protein